MASDVFRFRRFEIYQKDAPMRVGTDGVLLGAWVSVTGMEKKILDIGTGTGLIGLMLAQRTESSGAVIDAVEPDIVSAELAAVNFLNSPWAERLNLHRTTIQDFSPPGSCKYDLIVSNPPYFSDSLVTPDPSRTAARHTVTLPYNEFVDSSVVLLKDSGRLAVILPVDSYLVFHKNASESGLSLIRKCDVVTKEGLPPKRIMAEYTKGVVNTAAEQSRLIIETGARHSYSEEYVALTGDFYLYGSDWNYVSKY